jgi:hypothetical protein
MLIASVAGWAISARAFLRIPFVEKSADWSRAVVAAEITRQTTWTVTPEWVEANMTDALAAKPRDWPRIRVLEGLAADHGVLLTPATQAARDRAYREDHGWFAGLQSCFWCALNRAHCDLDASLLCGLTLDLTPIGDFQSILRAATAYARGQTIDYFDVGLATIGVASTVTMQPVIKGSASMLKTARAARAVAKPLEESIVVTARRLIGFDKLSFPFTPRELTAMVDPRALNELTDLASDAGAITNRLPLEKSMLMMRKIDSPGEMRDLRRVTEAVDDKAPGALEALGKKRLFRTLRRPAMLVAEVVAAVLATLAAILMLVGNLSQVLLMRILRRAAR